MEEAVAASADLERLLINHIGRNAHHALPFEGAHITSDPYMLDGRNNNPVIANAQDMHQLEALNKMREEEFGVQRPRLLAAGQAVVDELTDTFERISGDKKTSLPPYNPSIRDISPPENTPLRSESGVRGISPATSAAPLRPLPSAISAPERILTSPELKKSEVQEPAKPLMANASTPDFGSIAWRNETVETVGNHWRTEHLA